MNKLSSITFLVAFIAGNSLYVPSIQAQDLSCDQLAAHPKDVTKPLALPGVEFDEIDVEKAIVACQDAINTQPENARLWFQYGRALDAGEQTLFALDVYKKAYELGSTIAAANLGYLYSVESPKVKRDFKKALLWYQRAADHGLPRAKRAVALMLERGEGVPAPDPERAAIYWRELADAGNAEANEKVGIAINEKTIAPLTPTEHFDRLKFAAEHGRIEAANHYAYLIKNIESTPENLANGAKYALLAYRLAADASLASDAGWLPHQWYAFQMYQHFIQTGAHNTMPAAEYAQAQRDYASKNIVRLSQMAICSGTPTSVDVYVWNWNRDYPPTDPQAEWLQQARGCTIDQESLEDLRSLYAYSTQHNLSFSWLIASAIARHQLCSKKRQDTSSPAANSEHGT